MKSIAYVDSSAILRILLREDATKAELGGFQELFTSELTDVECRRTLDRIRIGEALSDEQVAQHYTELASMLLAFRVIRLSAEVLKRARGSFPTTVRTLDALHLSTALLAKEAIAQNQDTRFYLVTHDSQQKTAARSLGFLIH